ncbi:CYTH domain-containing protein [Ferrimonas balearica]|uniref:CYTH domain-containing protein n=1 Tax=Ferrimonas balearica TaxID=44012 RepID=UPI001C99A555|nr:CYTH domain-containing protein [Ferrimonas balearica]MBY5921528.1 CYTH domain-containing protein [Ferrimonas balearica]MBY5995787.1 CYTH domain-containing protein [Ferrimonas balearica]
MSVEIERKYRVSGDGYKQDAHKLTRITQGYLCSVPERTVRVRVKGDKGFLTIKGIGNASGASRYEWEREIPLEDAKALMALCEPGVIDKTRYLVDHGALQFEVDEFYGDNEGLVVAEVELESEEQAVSRPEWLGEEVTGDARYYNSMLMKQPYSKW